MNLRQEHTAQFHVWPLFRQQLVQSDHAVQQKSFATWEFVELGTEAALQVLQNHRHQCNISDFVAHERVTHVVWPQCTQVDDAGSAHKRSDEAHHKIDRVIGGQNAQVANAGPERVPGRQCATLFQIILVGEHATLRTAAGAGRIHNAGHIVFLPHDKIGSAFAFEIFPAISSGKIGANWSFGDENDLGLNVGERGGLRDRPPQVILDN